MTPLGGLAEALRPELDRVRRLIARSLQSDIGLLNRTNEALLDHPGKMLRPVLALLSARACGDGSVGEDALRVAAAGEILHNATLLHDDVVDGSPSRRGRPTVMALLGSRASVLLGDFWLVRSVDLILALGRERDRILGLFSKTLSDLAEGELLQLQKAESLDTTLEDYLRIIYSKTASLFETVSLSAALSAGAPPAFQQAIAAYARALGIAFQIRDDILDYTGDASLGKPVGQDLVERKITLPFLGALEGLSAVEAGHLRRRLARLDARHGAERVELMALVVDRGGIAYAEERLGAYIDEAIAALAPLPSGEDRSALETLARFVGERNV